MERGLEALGIVAILWFALGFAATAAGVSLPPLGWASAFLVICAIGVIGSKHRG